MNKFAKNISGSSSTLSERAAIVASTAKRAQEDLVREFEGKVDDLKLRVIQMCDISPDNTQSLKPSGQAAENPKL